MASEATTLRNVAALVLAAGESRRMGRPKAFLPIDGTTFLGEIAAAAEGMGCLTIVSSESLKEAIAQEASTARIVVNPDPARGQFSSLCVGLKCLGEQRSDWLGCIVFLTDHPGRMRKRVEILGKSIHSAPDRVHIACHMGEAGHPLFLPQSLWNLLESWNGEEGLRGFLKSHGGPIVPVETGLPETSRDVDTPEDYAAIGGTP